MFKTGLSGSRNYVATCIHSNLYLIPLGSKKVLFFFGKFPGDYKDVSISECETKLYVSGNKHGVYDLALLHQPRLVDQSTESYIHVPSTVMPNACQGKILWIACKELLVLNSIYGH